MCSDAKPVGILVGVTAALGDIGHRSACPMCFNNETKRLFGGRSRPDERWHATSQVHEITIMDREAINKCKIEKSGRAWRRSRGMRG